MVNKSDVYDDNDLHCKKTMMCRTLSSATFSTALRGKVGISVVTYNKEEDEYYIQNAWNGFPEGIKRVKCETDAPSIEESRTLPEVLHAEEMLVTDAAREGWDLKDGIAFITRTPCKKCASCLVNAGIKKLYYFSEHPHGDGLPILKEAGVKVEKLNFEQDILEEKYL